MSVISNYDIYDIFKKLKIPIACCCRDELMHYKKFNSFIINYSYSFDGTGGSHWVALFLDKKKKTAYYSDSFGRFPIDEVVDFCKKMKCKTLHYNNTDLQNKYAYDCGWYASSFIVFMHRQSKDVGAYANMFSNDTLDNDNILIKYMSNILN
jgi:hypothetical protein